MNKIKSEQEIIETFLNTMAITATQHEFEKHMNLISKKSKFMVCQALMLLVMMTGLVSVKMNLKKNSLNLFLMNVLKL